MLAKIKYHMHGYLRALAKRVNDAAHRISAFTTNRSTMASIRHIRAAGEYTQSLYDKVSRSYKDENDVTTALHSAFDQHRKELREKISKVRC